MPKRHLVMRRTLDNKTSRGKMRGDISQRVADSPEILSCRCFGGNFSIVIGVLYLAETWGNAGSHQCVLQFPLKWFGCVMVARENLAGGLIAGGGALLLRGER